MFFCKLGDGLPRKRTHFCWGSVMCCFSSVMTTVLFLGCNLYDAFALGLQAGGVIHTKLVWMVEGDGGASFADFAV